MMSHGDESEASQAAVSAGRRAADVFADHYALDGALPVHHWKIAAGCVMLGAVLGVVPFYLDYRAMGKSDGSHALVAVVEKIQNLEIFSERINLAMNHRPVIQGTVLRKPENPPPPPGRLPDSTTQEARRFSEFMFRLTTARRPRCGSSSKPCTARKANGCRLLLGRYLPSYFCPAPRRAPRRAVHRAHCEFSARRIRRRRLGLLPFIAEPDKPFDAERHQAAGKPGKKFRTARSSPKPSGPATPSRENCCVPQSCACATLKRRNPNPRWRKMRAKSFRSNRRSQFSPSVAPAKSAAIDIES